MTDGTPGWFRDPSDPALARWHDGERWTDHTLVIADQTPGEEPPPPDLDSAGAGFVPADPGFRAGRPNRMGDLPMWAKVALPVGAIAIVVLLAVVLLGGGDSGKDKTETAATQASTLDDAVDAARAAGLPSAVSDARAGALIERICTAARTGDDTTQLAADLAQLPASSPDDVRSNVADLGAGAKVRCKRDMADAPGLISRLQDEAAIAFSTTTTAVTVAGDGTTTAGTDGGTTGTTSKPGKTTSTTKKGSTATTAKPKPTTTTAPLPIAQEGRSCSSPGAKAQTKRGVPLSCVPSCGVGYHWSSTGSVCSSTTTLPPTNTTAVPPTAPPTSSGTTGGTGGPTTGGP
jgi:hypothetical protein